MALLTHQGQVRDHNEDFVRQREPINIEDANRNGWLFIVADGVGGADAGEVASEFATDHTIHHYLDSETADWGQRLHDAMQAANTDLRQMVAERNDHTKMATTMVAAVIHDGRVTMANVGDSRGYHWRDGTLKQITKDQSLVAKLVEEGAITEEEAMHHPRKNVILYSLGSEKNPQIDIYEQELAPGDILFFCSDGLTRHVMDDEIADIIGGETPNIAAKTLVGLANQRGGQDNITVVVVHYHHRLTAVTEPETLPAAVIPSTIPTLENLSTGTPGQTARRAILWTYTLILSLVQTILIILAWLILRV